MLRDFCYRFSRKSMLVCASQSRILFIVFFMYLSYLFIHISVDVLFIFVECYNYVLLIERLIGVIVFVATVCGGGKLEASGEMCVPNAVCSAVSSSHSRMPKRSVTSDPPSVHSIKRGCRDRSSFFGFLFKKVGIDNNNSPKSNF